MKIREIAEPDLEGVWHLNEAMVPMVGQLGREAMDDLCSLADCALAVEVGGTLAGFCLVFAPGSSYSSTNYRFFAKHAPEAYYLDRVAFGTAFQRQGLGSKLYAHVEALLLAQGVKQLALEVNLEPPNPESLSFHRRHGFVEVAQERTNYATTVSMQIKRLGAH